MVSFPSRSDPCVHHCIPLLAAMVTVVQMSDPIIYCEALVYCVGTMKLLSGNTQLQKELGEQGCISALSQLIAIINVVRSDGCWNRLCTV